MSHSIAGSVLPEASKQRNCQKLLKKETAGLVIEHLPEPDLFSPSSSQN
jgi:hypothetical protein